MRCIAGHRVFGDTKHKNSKPTQHKASKPTQHNTTCVGWGTLTLHCKQLFFSCEKHARTHHPTHPHTQHMPPLFALARGGNTDSSLLTNPTHLPPAPQPASEERKLLLPTALARRQTHFSLITHRCRDSATPCARPPHCGQHRTEEATKHRRAAQPGKQGRPAYAFFAFWAFRKAWAAARRAMGTRRGEQDT